MIGILEKILAFGKVSHTQFAKDVGVSKSYIVPMLKGEKNITPHIYQSMLALPYVKPFKDGLSELYFRQRTDPMQYKLIMCYLSEAAEFRPKAKIVPPPAIIYNLFTILKSLRGTT